MVAKVVTIMKTVAAVILTAEATVKQEVILMEEVEPEVTKKEEVILMAAVKFTAILMISLRDSIKIFVMLCVCYTEMYIFRFRMFHSMIPSRIDHLM